MEAIYQEEKEYDKKLESNEYSSLCYYSKKAIKNIYPNGGFKVIGAIGEGLKETSGTFQYKDETHSYFQMGFAKWKYGVDGYIALEDEQFIAVVKNRLVKNLIISIVTVAIIAGIVTGVALALQKDSDIDELAKDYTPSNKITANTDANHIALPGYEQIRIEEGSDTAYVALWNPPENPCYFKYTITLADTKEVVYESKMIPPGKAITSVKLKKSFTKGSYDLSIKIETFALDEEKTSLNGGEINSKLVVLAKDE